MNTNVCIYALERGLNKCKGIYDLICTIGFACIISDFLIVASHMNLRMYSYYFKTHMSCTLVLQSQSKYFKQYAVLEMDTNVFLKLLI